MEGGTGVISPLERIRGPFGSFEEGVQWLKCSTIRNKALVKVH